MTVRVSRHNRDAPFVGFWHNPFLGDRSAGIARGKVASQIVNTQGCHESAARMRAAGIKIANAALIGMIMRVIART
jgi:hypothetical protein